MQAVILAAGFGKRLRPITDAVPKALVEVGGAPLLVNALEQLSAFAVAETVIVVGHKKDMIIERIGHTYGNMRITYVENPDYAQTNNVYSLYLAKNYIHDDVILLECDLFYNRNVIDAVMRGKGACNILVSPFNPQTMDGTVLCVSPDMTVESLLVKRRQGPAFDPAGKMKTVNIYTFRQEFLEKSFFPLLAAYVETQSRNSYYELVLGALVYFGEHDIRAVAVDESSWCEIDDVHDLERAQRRFRRAGANLL